MLTFYTMKFIGFVYQEGAKDISDWLYGVVGYNHLLAIFFHGGCHWLDIHKVNNYRNNHILALNQPKTSSSSWRSQSVIVFLFQKTILLQNFIICFFL